MREPSIHIKENTLSLVLDKIKEFNDLSELSSKELAKLIVQKSKNKSCDNRIVIVSNNKMEKKTQKILKSSKEDANLLATLILMVRRKNKHRGVTKMTQDHREWPKVKELSEICIQFCNDFGLPKKSGFTKYLEIGFGKINSYRNYLSKLISMGESIANEYEAIIQIQDDPKSQETEEIHLTYTSMISERTGIVEEFKDKPLKYINFIKVREITDKVDIPADIFIKAQFYGLAWADSYPDPHQLVGDKAMERLNKYLFENKIRKGKKTDQKKENVIDALSRLKRKR